MAITNAGFADVRAKVQANWKYLELRDASNAPTGTRINVNTDARCSWGTSGDSLTLTVVLTCSDTDMGAGKVIKGASLFDVTSGGVSYLDEVYDNANTFEQSDDKFTIKITINAPSA